MALYYPPITPRSPIFANTNYAIPNTPVSAGGTGTITEEFLATNYLQFPGAQGVENFGFKELQLNSTNLGETATLYINPNVGQDVVLETTQTNGSLTIQTSATTNNTMVLSPSTGLTFGDGTTQITAYNDINTVQTDQSNIFQAGFTQSFNGPVNLNGATNGITQLTGNNTTLLATTAFVQDAVQVSGVQVGDSPLLWSGANTNQYNSSSGTNLTYSYPFGLSQLYNLSGGNEEFSLVANNGVAGPEDNAFSIYCTQGNQTGTQLRNLIPQLILSNNNTPMSVRDGINVNNKNISNINTLSGNAAAINISSPISMNSGNGININNESLYLFSGTEFSAITQSDTQNQLTIFNNAPNSNNTSNISFNLNNGTGTQFNTMQIYPNAISLKVPINMNDNNLTGLNNLSVSTGQTLGIVDGVTNIMTFNTSGINSYENITMNTGNLIMGTNNISGIGTLSGTGLGDILITSGLNFSTGSGINCGGGSIINCNSITDTTGNLVTTTTPTDNNITTAIATTGYVQSAISGGVSGVALLNPQPTSTQTFTGAITFSVNPTSTTALPWGTNSTTIATTQFVQGALPKYTSSTLSFLSGTPARATLVQTTYPVQTELISTSSQYNSVSFFDNPFSYVNTNVGGVPVGEQYVFSNPILILQFSVKPWLSFYQSPTTDTMVGTTSQGLTIAIPIGWSTVGNLYLVYIGASINAGNTITVTTSFSSLGLFPV